MTSKKPNVIVFFTDQQRWDTTGVHGNPLGLTPNFDRMAAEGTHLYHSFTCQPVCGPARACLQTGKYPTTMGCFTNGIKLPEEEKTLAHYFQEAGYRTGYIGKWHLADSDPVEKKQRGGYQDWLGANTLEFTSDAYDTVLFNNDNQEVKLPGYRADALTDAAIRYVDDHQDDPFFLFLSYIEPHHQNHIDDYPAPDGYRERYAGRWTPGDLAALGGSSSYHLGGYYGMVKRLDECLGRLLDSLKSLALDKSTVVLFTSDHGNHFKTRNGEYKRSCHESSIRVPTAITGPGFFGGGQIKQLTSLIDLPPTLLDAANLAVPDQMQGRSVVPLTKGAAENWPDEVFVQISESHIGRAVRTQRWKYEVTAPDKNGWDGPGSDIYADAFLYDLKADPHEMVNLIGSQAHRPVVERMRQRLFKRMKQANEKIPDIISASITESGQRQVKPGEIEQ